LARFAHGDVVIKKSLDTTTLVHNDKESHLFSAMFYPRHSAQFFFSLQEELGLGELKAAPRLQVPLNKITRAEPLNWRRAHLH
jgi:hypothetical protein